MKTSHLGLLASAVTLPLATALLAGCISNTTGGGGGSGDGGSAGNDSGASGGPRGFCDIDNGGTRDCIDYGADYTGSLPQGCDVLHGTYSATGACSHASSAGGCHQVFASGGSQTTWFYDPITPDTVKVQCTNDANATYVAP